MPNHTGVGSAVDPLAPTLGGVYYLVGGRSVCGSGSLGVTSMGALRPNTALCP